MPAEHAGRLATLPRNDRADLLLLALPNAALREACRQLQLTFPGYRLEAVKPGVIADSLSEEYETSEEDAATIDRIVEENCVLPPTIPEEMIPASRIPGRTIELLARVAAADPELMLAPLIWRLLGHSIEGVRTGAAAALRSYLEWYDAMAAEPVDETNGATEAPPEPESIAEPEPGDAAESALLQRRLKETETKSARLGADLEAARRQLATERAHGARKDERLSGLKRELEQAQAELRTTRDAKAALEASLDRDTRALLRRRESEVENLKHEVEGLQKKLEEARRREAGMLAERRDVKTPADAVAPAPAPVEAPAAPVESASGFQPPEFTAEFYESIEEWDERVVKTAFEKVLLLAGNFAHPSLDAKLLQGAEGLYRIKVATDVRLIYRRKPARGIEILSLIDRENLPRYVRQYKRRAHS